MSLCSFSSSLGFLFDLYRLMNQIKENDDRIDAADGKVVVVLEVAVPKGAPRAWTCPLGLPDEDWGYDRILGDMEGPPTHSGFGVFR